MTTDVLSRGLDFDGVNFVVNYEIPFINIGGIDRENAETYLHRVGRAGRFGRPGIAINFVDPASKRHIDAIAAYFGKTMVRLDREGIENKLSDIVEQLKAEVAASKAHAFAYTTSCMVDKPKDASDKSNKPSEIFYKACEDGNVLDVSRMLKCHPVASLINWRNSAGFNVRPILREGERC